MYAADGISGAVTSNCSAVIAARARLLKMHAQCAQGMFFGTLVLFSGFDSIATTASHLYWCTSSYRHQYSGFWDSQ